MLRIAQVSRRFGAKTAVDTINLEIPAGQMVGIIGRSGAGKSTLLRMINRLIDVSDGAIIGSNAVVTKDVADFAIAVGVPAKPIRERFPKPIADRLLALGWWDWEHEKLHTALPDFRALEIEAFLEKYE